MRRATRNTWIGVGLVLVLSVAVFVERMRDHQRALPTLLPAGHARVEHISIACFKCKTRRFQPIEGVWSMVEPWKIPARAAEIRNILALTEAPVWRQFELNQIDPDKLGFDAPFATLELGEHTIEFGGTDAIDHRRYVRMGRKILLITDKVSAQLVGLPERFVSRRVFAALNDGLFQINENGQPWPEDRVAAIRSLKALAVTSLPTEVNDVDRRALNMIDGAMQTHVYHLVELPDHKALLLRDDPPLAYQITSDAFKLFAPLTHHR